jgi:hypothetical protein
MTEPKKNKPQTKTGQVPRLELILPPVEPPLPPSIPEIADPGSTTGVMHVIGEGEDLAKHEDDSATSSPADARRPQR